jgi:hypothetical protein
MIESDWNRGDDPHAMLAFLRDSGRASERKARLFGCASLGRFGSLLERRPCAFAVQLAERLADGLAASAEVEAAHEAARRETYDCLGLAILDILRGAPELLGDRFSYSVSQWVASNSQWPKAASRDAARRAQAEVLRDILGPLPFRSVPIDAAWLTWNGGTVRRLAEAAYAERPLPSGQLDPARLAVLADALEEAGCQDAEILAHCRGTGPHARGCWVLDLLLAKE